MPNVNISLNDKEFETLQNLKKVKNLRWKDLLISNIDRDINLDRINESFTTLEPIVPDLQESLQYIKAVLIRFYKLSADDRKIQAEKLNKISIKYFNEIMNSIKEVSI